MIQDDCYEEVVTMIKGAMKEISCGKPKYLDIECGPVINSAAQIKLLSYIDKARRNNQIIEELDIKSKIGFFVAPTLIRLESMDDIQEEFFGPILHVLSYKDDELEKSIDLLNSKGFGLTFGIHSRIEKKVKDISLRVNAGNIYINRNQIGAVVGSQPFGGEGLSGTGPKAGGPNSLHGYSQNILSRERSKHTVFLSDDPIDAREPLPPSLQLSNELLLKLKRAFPNIEEDFFEFLYQEVLKYSSDIFLPGPTGESNQLSYKPKGTVLCLGPEPDELIKQTLASLFLGNSVICPISSKDFNIFIELGFKKENILRLNDSLSMSLLVSNLYSAVFYSGNSTSMQEIILASRIELIPIVSSIYEAWELLKEQVVTEDTTASGGNANLLAL